MTNPTKIVQLSVLTLAVAISQAFRTVPAITFNGIAEEMNAGPAALALFGGNFHWSFALMQIPVGLALDIFGVRHTMIAFSGFAILGGAICALAPNMNWLFLGQTLIGIGCAPAFMLRSCLHPGIGLLRVSPASPGLFWPSAAAACFCRPHRWLGLSIAGLGGSASSF